MCVNLNFPYNSGRLVFGLVVFLLEELTDIPVLVSLPSQELVHAGRFHLRGINHDFLLTLCITYFLLLLRWLLPEC
jgi:hypothetical protein